MDYIKEYKSFINSHSLGEGVRITTGVVLPAVILGYFNLLSVGVVVSLGAMCVSLTDTSGPIHHRLNGMVAACIISVIVSLLTGFAAPHPVTLGLLITLFCFILSMIGVYGSRANSIGVAALIVMVLSIDRTHDGGWDIVYNAGYVLAGGAWYTLMSLLLYRVRPYKLAQQVLGDCIEATASYLRTRASFYDKEVDFEKTYKLLLDQQIILHEKQNMVREILFKTRSIVKDSTNTGRVLVMIFRDSIDLFERAMTAYQDYEALHKAFDKTDILQRYQLVILELAKELDEIGIAVKSGEVSEESGLLQQHVSELHHYFESYVLANRKPENLEGFISLRHILNGIEDIASRIHTLHLYTTYDRKHTKKLPSETEYEKFITHTVIDSKLLRDNFSFKSNTFRHAIRLSVATLAGYIISKFFPFGHSYWILLTIIVILKPAYSLTQKRNYERLLGTIAGALAGLAILYFIKDSTTLFILMLFLMVGTYSLMRTRYMVSIFFMTPYIMLLFHLLNSTNTQTLLLDRVIDTGIGSAIAFLANFFLIPAWEKDQIKNYMLQALADNEDYFKRIAGAYTGTPFTNLQYKLSRKKAFVSLANLSDAFSRMLSEPKSKQQNSKLIHQFVVLNHMLTSHIATLSYYADALAPKYSAADFIFISDNSIAQFEQAIDILNGHQPDGNLQNVERSNLLDKKVNELMEKRRKELENGELDTVTKQTVSEFKSIVDQFNFIAQIAVDIKKISWQIREGRES